MKNGFGKLRPSLDWCSLPGAKRGLGFHPIPCIGLAVRRRLRLRIRPRWRVSYLRIGTGPSPLFLIEIGEVMSANQPTGAKKKSVPKKVDGKALEVVHPDAAGIDVGGSEHWVAVSPDRDPEPVRCFGCFTADLREMARWLAEKGVRSVAIAYA